MSDGQVEIPTGWTWATLGELGSWSGGGTPSKAQDKYWIAGTIPWVSPKDMKVLRLLDSEDHVTAEALGETVITLSPVGTVLVVVRSGILQRTLPVAVAQVPVTMNQDMKGIGCATGVEPMFVAYYLIRSERDILSQCSKDGTTVASIETERLRHYSVPLAPTCEQRRIVDAIEQQFSRLDAGVAALKRTQAALKRYRAAVLKAAVEGKLTEAWRAAHPDVEPASRLLERILAERRVKWEADLRARGKDPAKAKYLEPKGPDTSNLPALPEGWCWSSLGECFQVHVGATPSRAQPEYWGGSIPWVSSGEVQFCRIRETRERITEAGLAHSSTQVNPRGSILLGMIGEGKTRGQVAMLDIDACNNQNCAAIWVTHTPVVPELIYYWLWSQYEITRRRSSGNNQPALNKSRVEEMEFPFPPVLEQHEIIAEVERRLSVVDTLEAAVEANLKRAERLRQSILERAFSGQLVPQDPEDEPGRVLLERIRQERESTRGASNGRSHRKSAHDHRNPAVSEPSDIRQGTLL